MSVTNFKEPMLVKHIQVLPGYLHKYSDHPDKMVVKLTAIEDEEADPTEFLMLIDLQNLGEKLGVGPLNLHGMMPAQ